MTSSEEDFYEEEDFNIRDYPVTNDELCLHIEITQGKCIKCGIEVSLDEKEEEAVEIISPPPKENECKHLHSINNHASIICIDCGKEISQVLSVEQEWRYYGNSDSKHTSDPSRCSIRKTVESSIYKDVEKFNFPPGIVEIANNYFNIIRTSGSSDETPRSGKGDIKRGNTRKGIIFACLFNAYKSVKKPKTSESIQKILGIDKKTASRGSSYFTLRMPKKYNNLSYIHAVEYIPDIMKKFQANSQSIDQAVQLYFKIKHKSLNMIRSNQSSIAAGLVYYYIKLINRNKPDVININKFKSVVGLSNATILKIAKDISEILDTTNEVKIN
jgi:transcription initiation factor TFIIIB Brf1 subunit/transcription initiation factor TFIIB